MKNNEHGSFLYKENKNGQNFMQPVNIPYGDQMNAVTISSHSLLSETEGWLFPALLYQ